MLPLAPGLLSTTTGWPSDFDIDGAIMRATVSRMPPGATGTTSVTVLFGNPWAPAQRANEAIDAATNVRNGIFILNPPADSIDRNRRPGIELSYERSRPPVCIRHRDRRRRRPPRAPGDRLAPRPPPEPRARQPRVPHLQAAGRAPALAARHRGARAGRPHGGDRHPEGWAARARRGAARRHRRAARRRAGRRPVPQQGEDRMERRAVRRDA